MTLKFNPSPTYFHRHASRPGETLDGQRALTLKGKLDEFAGLLQEVRLVYEPQGPLARKIDAALQWSGYLEESP